MDPPGAAASDYVIGEWSKALNAGKLVNVRALEFPRANVSVPFNASHIDRLELDEPQRILKSIRRARTKQPRHPSHPADETPSPGELVRSQVPGEWVSEWGTDHIQPVDAPDNFHVLQLKHADPPSVPR